MNKILLIIILFSLQSYSKDFDLFDVKKNYVEIKAKKYILLTYGELACKQCYGQLVYAISKIDSTIPVYCIVEDEQDMMRRKFLYGTGRNYSGLETYFYVGADPMIFRYSPNVLIVENGFHSYIRHEQLFTRDYTLESIIEIMSKYLKE